MKKILFTVAVLATSFASIAQVGVGTTDPKAGLDITSDKGMLLPRIADHTTLTPVDGTLDANEAGLQVYNTTTKKVMLWDGTVWVANSNKWVDDTFGSIVLDNGAMAKDSVKYSSHGGKVLFPISKPVFDTYDAGSASFTSTNIYDNGIYISDNALSTSIVKTDNSNPNPLTTGSTYTARNIIDNSETRTSTNFVGMIGAVQTNQNTTTNIKRIVGTIGSAKSLGTKVNDIRGGSFETEISPNSDYNTVDGVLIYNNNQSSSNGNTMYGVRVLNKLAGTGTISFVMGNRAQLYGDGSTNVTNYQAFRAQTSLTSNYTGTITNAYDFYAPEHNAGSGTITNSYGIFVIGDSKINYVGGNLGIGATSPLAKLHVNGYIKLGDSDVTGDAAPVDGMMRYNTTTKKFQGRANGAWVDLH